MNNNQSKRSVIPIYTTRGDPEAFLVYPYLFNRVGEWIGWVSAERQVYSVLGIYVGELTAEPRIVRNRITSTLKPRKTSPPRPPNLLVPATIPLAPLLGDLRFGLVDVLMEQPELLHTTDTGDLTLDLD